MAILIHRGVETTKPSATFHNLQMHGEVKVVMTDAVRDIRDAIVHAYPGEITMSWPDKTRTATVTLIQLCGSRARCTPSILAHIRGLVQALEDHVVAETTITTTTDGKTEQLVLCAGGVSHAWQKFRVSAAAVDACGSQLRNMSVHHLLELQLLCNRQLAHLLIQPVKPVKPVKPS